MLFRSPKTPKPQNPKTPKPRIKLLKIYTFNSASTYLAFPSSISAFIASLTQAAPASPFLPSTAAPIQQANSWQITLHLLLRPLLALQSLHHQRRRALGLTLY